MGAPLNAHITAAMLMAKYISAMTIMQCTKKLAYGKTGYLSSLMMQNPDYSRIYTKSKPNHNEEDKTAGGIWQRDERGYYPREG
jgi:hypothetical protein